jgi:hypothetical protein
MQDAAGVCFGTVGADVENISETYRWQVLVL